MIRPTPVFTDDPGWHGKRLKRAFANREREIVFVSLKDCSLDLTPNSLGVVIPGFGGSLPQGVFVRGVPGGTLQQVIARLDILHALKMLGVKVYNDGQAVERTVDKAMTSFLLHINGIPTPDTWVCESREAAHRIMLSETTAGKKLVIKPLFGSQGLGVRCVEHGKSFSLPMDEHVDGLYYLQSYINSGEDTSHDYRILIVNGRAVAAMVRRGSDWVNNVARGGRCEPMEPAGEIVELAIAAAAAVNIDYCGVDVIRDRKGNLFVLEVNSIPAWKGLQSVTKLDVAQCLVDDFIAKLES